MPVLAILAMLASAAGADARPIQDAREARDQYARAQALDAQGNHAAALALLWEAAARAPRDPEIQTALGDALVRLGALDAAIAAYQIAVAERPGFRKAQDSLILTLARAGRGREAVDRARALVASAPDDADRWFTLGLAQAEQDVVEAASSFRRAIALAPRHVLARYNLALVLRRSDRLAEAIAELEAAQAIEKKPELAYTLGVIYWHQGDLTRAEASLRSALKLASGHAEAREALGSVLKAQGRYADAVDELTRAVALRPEFAPTHYALAQALRLSGNERKASEELATAERLRRRGQLEQEAASLTAVGSAALASGDVGAAVTHLRRATETFADYAPAQYQLGLALQRAGDLAAARAAFAKAQRLNPSLVPPLNGRPPGL